MADTQMVAMIAYLQRLGTDLFRLPPEPPASVAPVATLPVGDTTGALARATAAPVAEVEGAREPE
jgi:hypothetical protein